MALLDERRRHLDVNGAHLKLFGYRREALIGRPVYELVVGGPEMSPAQWAEALAVGHFTGETEALAADGTNLAVQWAATTENVTGQRLVLFVALSTSTWGRRFRRPISPEAEPGALPSASARSCDTSHAAARGPRSPMS
jgi:PAS domain S-box-containing protein